MCTDGGSGIVSCPPDRQITTEGTDQTMGATATDRAGNATSTTSVTAFVK